MTSLRRTLSERAFALSRCAAGVALCGVAAAQTRQISFSVDWQGVLQGKQSTSGVPFTAGDVLVPEGGRPHFAAELPELRFTGGFLGITAWAGCVGSGPGDACVELDALSYGRDARLKLAAPEKTRIWFSTDEYALGAQLPTPSVSSEAPLGDVCADVFVARDLPPLPVQLGTPPNHRGVVDGDGLPNPLGTVYLGLGTAEPNVPGTGLPNFPFDPGDNLDALDVGVVADPSTERIWFSLDGTLFDPLSGTNGAGTAQAQGVDPADVLVRFPSGQVAVFAQAGQLGLDRAGAGTDDLDALILAENGQPGYQRSQVPYDWESGSTDMLLFSVRRGSAVIGAIDSLQGLKISEGDLLGPPAPGGNGNPSVLIPAEALGLRTLRGGAQRNDDLNAGDSEPDAYHDCNDNGFEDAEDIAGGVSHDDNLNGIPDECERPGTVFCFCATGGVCGNNPDGGAGCANSTGAGAFLEGTGSSSVFLDDLVLRTSNLPPNKFGQTFMGAGTTTAFLGGGIRCVDPGGVGLYRFPVKSSGSNGSFELGPGLAKFSCNHFPPQACIEIGATWYFQSWYRDGSSGSCGKLSNVSSALEVLFTD